MRTERLDDAPNDIASAHARRERAVHRQIVEGQRHRVAEPRPDPRAPSPAPVRSRPCGQDRQANSHAEDAPHVFSSLTVFRSGPERRYTPGGAGEECMTRVLRLCVVAGLVTSCGIALVAQAPAVPHLRKQGSATQLVVDGRPFLVRGGELGNSSASNLEYLAPHWDRLRALGLNTILAPVSWDLLEPDEGKFDFTLVDGLVAGARTHDLRLVLLWFGSWKNSMSCYAPGWVKKDQRRFPRAVDASGRASRSSPRFRRRLRDADARAFGALMKHLRAIDGDRHTVLMVQVENEIGMIPSARDHSEQASRLFAGAVPGELMTYLVDHAESLAPELRATWLAAGAKRAGTWTDVFGPGDAAEEIFMAWHFARFTDRVAAAGKAEYPLPMFLNAALDPSGISAGPVSERRSAAAPARRVARGCAGGRFPRARHLLPDVRRVDAPLRARREPALHPGGAAKSGCRGEFALRLRDPRRDWLLALRDRVDPGAGRAPPRGEQRRRRGSSRRSSLSTRGPGRARWRGSFRSIRTTGSRSSSGSTGTS